MTLLLLNLNRNSRNWERLKWYSICLWFFLYFQRKAAAFYQDSTHHRLQSEDGSPITRVGCCYFLSSLLCKSKISYSSNSKVKLHEHIYPTPRYALSRLFPSFFQLVARVVSWENNLVFMQDISALYPLALVRKSHFEILWSLVSAPLAIIDSLAKQKWVCTDPKWWRKKKKSPKPKFFLLNMRNKGVSMFSPCIVRLSVCGKL